jgi:Loader and inhibitor of phage G40P
MEKDQVISILSVIEVNYPNFYRFNKRKDSKNAELANEKFKIWYRLLINMDYGPVMKKLELFIQTSKFEPKIADIAVTKSEYQLKLERQTEIMNKKAEETYDTGTLDIESLPANLKEKYIEHIKKQELLKKQRQRDLERQTPEYLEKIELRKQKLKEQINKAGDTVEL